MSGLSAISYFLFSLFFNILTFVLWARLALCYFQISTLHPIRQMITNLTDPIVQPMTRLFPPIKTKSRYDWHAFVILVIVELFKYITLSWLVTGMIIPSTWLVLYTLADLIIQPCNLLFYAIIIRVIMSWVNPGWQHPIAGILFLITEPSLRLARRYLPDMAGLDFTPFIVMLGLKIIILFISASLPTALG